MLSLYPMKFVPILKEKIWGGQNIKSIFGIFDDDIVQCGEAWMLSAVKGNESEVANGHFAGNTIAEMAEIFMDDLLGEDVYRKYVQEFPLLLKIIDANDYLSVQVHPNNDIALKKHKLRFGKSEMWYVIHADPGAHIISGFNHKMDRNTLLKHVENGSLRDVLNFEPMSTGDMVYLPAGMVHALGPGLVIAEIQQTSDITYRLYDWDRADENGNTRELHITDAADAIDYNMKPEVFRGFNPKINQTTPMLETEFFSAAFVNLHSEVKKNLESVDSFVLYFSISGRFKLEYGRGVISVSAGECVLVPAVTSQVVLTPETSAQVIEILPK